MNGKLIFTEYNYRQLAMLLQYNRLLAVQALPEGDNRIGAVYIGKVKKVTHNINACFVEIAHSEICFLPLKEASAPFLLNRKYDGRILEGDELLVQITKEAQKTKQAAVTAKISLSNELFALCVDSSARAGFSGKLSAGQKQALQELLTQNGILQSKCFVQEEGLPALIGGIVRTQAGECSEEELLPSYYKLREQFVKLLTTAMHRTCFTCLKEAPPAYLAVLDTMVYPYEFEEILTDNEVLYKQLCDYCAEKLPDKKVRLYADTDYPLSKLYSLETKLNTALGKQVWLKSGGYLVIEPTEALTVIDVNSGKFEGLKGTLSKNARENAYKINMEAAQEIALQLRLRNLSGIIVVDFINMDSPKYDSALLEQLRGLVIQDKLKTSVIDITPLGLVEITRKKSNKPLHEQLR